MHWVEMLPDTQTPSWLGLPSNAEKVLLTTQGLFIYLLSFMSFISVIGGFPLLFLIAMDTSFVSDLFY